MIRRFTKRFFLPIGTILLQFVNPAPGSAGRLKGAFFQRAVLPKRRFLQNILCNTFSSQCSSLGEKLVQNRSYTIHIHQLAVTLILSTVDLRLYLLYNVYSVLFIMLRIIGSFRSGPFWVFADHSTNKKAEAY